MGKVKSSCQCTLLSIADLSDRWGLIRSHKQDHLCGEGTLVLFRSLGNDPRTDFATGSVFVPMGFVLSWSHRLLLLCQGVSLRRDLRPTPDLRRVRGTGCWPCGIAHLRVSALHQVESTLRECVILHPSLANVQAGKNSVHRLP